MSKKGVTKPVLAVTAIIAKQRGMNFNKPKGIVSHKYTEIIVGKMQASEI